MKPKYPWRRFWVPRSKQVNLSDEGFLYDPESEWAYIYNPDVVSFESIQDRKVLVLLGEPGIGKSSFLESERDRINKLLGHLGQDLLWLNLGAYDSQDLLARDLFGTPEFSGHSSSKNELHVFLDSLDECKLSIPKITTFLKQEFARRYTDRLYIRIACRTAVWPAPLEEMFKSLWDEKEIGVFELALLRRKDVALAAA